MRLAESSILSLALLGAACGVPKPTPADWRDFALNAAATCLAGCAYPVTAKPAERAIATGQSLLEAEPDAGPAVIDAWTQEVLDRSAAEQRARLQAQADAMGAP
jgi:hypothetical protein